MLIIGKMLNYHTMIRNERTAVPLINKIPMISSGIVLGIGLIVLTGWKLQSPFLMSVSEEYMTMKPNAALCFAFLGAAMLLSNPVRRGRRRLVIAGILALCVIMIALLTLAEHISGADLGIDRMLFTESHSARASLVPGRMPWTAALSFLLSSFLIFMTGKNSLQKISFHLFAYLIGFTALFDLNGYLYGTQHIYGTFYNQMAIHSTIAFIFLGVGFISRRPDEGLARITLSKTLGGITFRRLILGALIAPAILAWFILKGYNAQIINFEEMIVIFSVTGIITLSLVIWSNARLLDRLDIQREYSDTRRVQSEQKYKTLLTEMGEGVLQTDLRETIEFVNSQFCSMLGYRPDDLMGKNVRMLFSDEDIDMIRSKTALRLRGISDRYETMMIRSSGEKIWASVSGAPLIGPGNSVSGSVAIVTDISEQKRIQKLNETLFRIAAAAQTARSLSDLFLSVHQIISQVMPANNFYISLYDRENDLISFPYFVDEVDTPELPRKPGRGLTEYVLRTGKSLLCDENKTQELIRAGEAEIVGAPSPIWLGVPLIVESGPIGAMVVQHYADASVYGENEKIMLEYVSDQVGKVIAHKKSEIELAESEHRFRNLYDNVPVGIYRTTPEGKILAANPILIKMMGCASFEELSHLDLEKHGYEEPGKRAIFKAALEKEGTIGKYESTWRRQDGTIIHVSENAIAVRNEAGGIDFYEGMVEDITERKTVEAERERLIAELKKAVAEVQALSGLLPICASCKKIRDDSGYWNQLESFIETRATVQFSHGICPECLRTLYPQYYDRIKSQESSKPVKEPEKGSDSPLE